MEKINLCGTAGARPISASALRLHTHLQEGFWLDDRLQMGLAMQLYDSFCGAGSSSVPFAPSSVWHAS